MMARRWNAVLLLLAVPIFFAGCHAERRKVTLTLSLAASLKNAMSDVEARYKQIHPEIAIENNYGSSGTLAQQIEQGAPVDLFFSAAAKPMDDVEAKALLRQGSRANLLSNRLVLIAPRTSSLEDFEGLRGAGVRLIALGDPLSVPAGQYGQETLSALHLLNEVKPKLVLGKDVRQVLSYVQTDNADAGIVYATDAWNVPGIRVVATAAENTHSPVVYPVAILRDSPHPAEAEAFENFLKGAEARAIFAKHGFGTAAQ